MHSPQDLESLLVNRLGLDEDQKDLFLAPPYKMGDLWLFKDMAKAVERIYSAVKNGEHIGIYSDYDCDGIPGAVVLVDLFKKLNIMERVHLYIPDRHDEGYGLSTLGLDALEKEGVSVMITVDVGITAIATIADAQSRAIDVILTDHHQPLEELPSAYAIVHPANGSYPNQDPCGATMAFYLVCAFLEKHRDEFEVSEGWEKWLLDLVGFATLSDMVPLVGENRMLVAYGMHVMRKTRRVGLQILLEKNNISLHSLTESDLTFTVAPRLNAASRMATPMLAFELLETEDQDKATAIVRELDIINNERKTLVARIVKAAHTSLEHRILNEELSDIVVIGNPEWRPAVLGLVANKLQEKYNRSFFVWGEGGDGSIKGSCRMRPDHHAALLFQALPEDLMIHAGGHQAAGGFSISKDKVHIMEDALNNVIASVGHEAVQDSNENIIALSLVCTTPRHLAVVRKFAPFGVGNAEPHFSFEKVIVQSVKMFGKNKEHIECNVIDGSAPLTTRATAVAFAFFADQKLIESLSTNSIVNIVGTMESGWRGGVRIRIREVN